MPDPSILFLFIVTALAIVVPPGPAVLYVIARSIDHGRLAGIVATLGISTATLVHIAAAAFGVSAILMSSTLLFNGLKYAGAIYLVYLGVRNFIDRDDSLKGKGSNDPQVAKESQLGPIYRQGIIVNLLNPKTSLFFLAFLPQFVVAEKGGVATQILLLGAIFVTIGFFTDGLWALLAGTVRNWIRGNARYLKGQRLFTGSVYIGLGVVTALTGSSRQ